MNINRQIFQSIQKALRKSLYCVPANKTWTELRTELSIGTLAGNKINLSKEDRDKLRQFVINDTGIDPLTDDIFGDRLELAKKTANEKLSNQAVFGQEIKLFRNANLPISLTSGNTLTPEGSYLATDINHIDLNNIDKIIVVENGIVFKHWFQSNIPQDIMDALVIYRGHDTGSQDIKTLLGKNRENIQLFAAVDFDPAGFRIALGFDADAILIPEQYEQLRLQPNTNKNLVFEKQNTQECASIIPLNWVPVWDYLHNSRTAITQESILAKNWPLRALYK